MAKISRKKLLKEPDEFLSFSQKLMVFLMEHKVHLCIGLSAIIAGSMIFAGVRYFIYKSENEAFAKLGKAMNQYESLLDIESKPADFEPVKSEVKAIMDKYNGRQGAKLAAILYAKLCYATGKTDDAIQYYQQSFKDFEDDTRIKTMILNGLAYAYEKKGDYSSAIQYFQQLVALPDATMKGEVYFNLGRLYELDGKLEKAIQMYKIVDKDYKDSIYADLVKEKIQGV